MSGDSHMTLRRILRLIDILAYKRTTEEIADLLKVSPRTVYRYVQTLRDVGKPVEQDVDRRWYLKE